MTIIATQKNPLIEIAKWIGTLFGVAGALLIAANIPSSKYAFLVFLGSSSLWGIVAYKTKEHALLILQIVFAMIDSFGIYRWLL